MSTRNIVVFTKGLDNMQYVPPPQGAVESNEVPSVFIDARGGTGKIFVLNTILAAVRMLEGGSIALAVGVTGIAANLISLGRNFHSRFKVPLNISQESVRNIDAQRTLAQLICQAKIIV